MLLEVMLSVFIVSVGVVFVVSSFITSIKAFKISQSYIDMLFLTEEKMWDYEGIGELEEGSDSGEFEDHEGAEWSVEAEEIEGELPLNETSVEITLKEGDKKRKLTMVTYFFAAE